jgi:hypothetical protein
VCQIKNITIKNKLKKMKQKLILVVMILVISSSAIAQEGGGRQGGFQRRTVEERVKMMHSKFDSTFKFEAKKQANIDSAFAEQYRAQDKMREEMMAQGGQPDQATRDAMREKMQELNVARDEKLQTIMTEAEYKKWKSELEPSLRPQRGPGGQGGGGNRPAGN